MTSSRMTPPRAPDPSNRRRSDATVVLPGYPTREIAGRRIEYALFPAHATRARVVLLHEGLGCVAMWRDFPARLAQALGEPVLAYSRYGYGGSQVLEAPRTDRFMHEEARDALPALLEAFAIDRPVLVGHSDGASIALLHAGLYPGVVRAVVAMAPHLFVEPVTLASIHRARAAYAGELASRLARYHADPKRTFDGWADPWLSAAFPGWNIEPEVAAIACPVLAIQGAHDEYGTMRQVERIAELVRGAEVLELDACGHSPQRDRPDAVLAAIAGFVGGLDLA